MIITNQNDIKIIQDDIPQLRSNVRFINMSRDTVLVNGEETPHNGIVKLDQVNSFDLNINYNGQELILSDNIENGRIYTFVLDDDFKILTAYSIPN